MNVLIDTNVLVAAFIKSDKYFQQAQHALEVLARQQGIVAAPVLVETFYLIDKVAGYSRAVQALGFTRLNFRIESLLHEDFVRIEIIMLQYQDARFDYTDAAIMAIAERLNITQIYTFDRRDFSIFRPRHCPAFELLP